MHAPTGPITGRVRPRIVEMVYDMQFANVVAAFRRYLRVTANVCIKFCSIHDDNHNMCRQQADHRSMHDDAGQQQNRMLYY